MVRSFKGLVHRALGWLGYRLVKIASARERTDNFDNPPWQQASQEELVKALPEIISKLQSQSDRPVDGYQLEMATYDLKTGMANLEADFFPIYERCRKYTMTSWQRLYNLYLTMRYVAGSNILGDIVECGVWRGGSMMLAALTLLSLGKVDRRLVLCDTFEGLPKPHEQLDIDIWGNRGIDGWRPHRKTDESSDWAYASLEEVRENMAKTGYPMERVSLVKGMVEQTLPAMAPTTIAVLRLDTDWYSSTRHELQHLYPRLSPGGVLILDDYGHFRGARKAVDEYFEGRSTRALLTRVDYAGRVAVKVA